jgi:hypothetical protein
VDSAPPIHMRSFAQSHVNRHRHGLGIRALIDEKIPFNRCLAKRFLARDIGFLQRQCGARNAGTDSYTSDGAAGG